MTTYDPPRPETPARLPWLIWALLIVSLVAWRKGVYFSGGVDPIVIAKAAVGGVALLLAYAALPDAAQRARLGARTPLIVLAYVVLSLLGAWAGESLFASAVLAVRVLMVLATVCLLVVSFPAAVLLRSMLTSMGVLGVVIGLTGLGSFAADGRLSGGVPPLAPNQLALLYTAPLLGLVWQLLHRTATAWHIMGVVVLAALTWMTGSRTGMLALALACLVVIVTAPRLKAGVIVVTVMSIPALFFVAAFTPILATYFGRGGAKNLTTLNSRTIAWEAAFSAGNDFWNKWFGSGMAVKTISVTGTYWDTQVLDSTWVSVFVQGGIVGITLLALWSVCTLISAGSVRIEHRSLWLALVIMVLIRSAVETGLFDSYVLFVAMLLPALVVERRTTDVAASASASPSSSPQAMSASRWRPR